MKDRSLNFRQTISVASLIFGLFFGAGNLIFPIFMGYLSGEAVNLASIGFLVTGVGLPFLAILALGVTESSTLVAFGNQVSPGIGRMLAMLSLLIIGPLFAMPRLATTTFEIAFASHLAPESLNLWLAGLSVVFFGLTWWFARRPSQLLDYVGKFLNPIFLALLVVIILFAFIRPVGSTVGTTVHPPYDGQPLLVGMTDGYQTLDAIAGLAFGVIISQSLRNLGVHSIRGITRHITISGFFGMTLMGIIYTLLAYMGAMSQNVLSDVSNGGPIFSFFAHHYLGSFGFFILALIIFTACLKTSIGLAMSFGETFNELFPSVSYQQFLVIGTVASAVIANVGLTQIIALSTPVLMFIYPIAIVLIILTLVNAITSVSQTVFKAVTYFTIVGGLIDGFKVAQETLFPQWIAGQSIANFFSRSFPGYDAGLAWVLPAAIGVVVGLILTYFRKDKSASRGI